MGKPNFLENIRKTEILIGLAIVIAYVTVSIAIHKDFSTGWESQVVLERGQHYAEFWRTGKLSINTWGDIQYYPYIAEMISYLGYDLLYSRWHLMDASNALNFFSIFVVAAAILVVYLFALYNFGQLSAVVSAVSLAIFPTFMNLTHVYSKDVMMGCFFGIALIAFWKAADSRSWAWVIIAGVLAGLAINTKINGVFIPLVALVWYFIAYREFYITGKLSIPKSAVKIVSYPLIIIPVVFATWPYLWTNPLGRFYEMLGNFLQTWRGSPLFYFGNVYQAGINVPWHFALVHIAVRTPLITLALAIVGLYYAYSNRNNKAAVLVVTWFLFVLIKQSLPGVVMYGGIIHMMEIVLALSLLAGMGAQWLYKEIRPHIKGINPQEYTRWFMIGLLALHVPVAYSLYVLHPYQFLYFNKLIGGIKGTENRLENDWYPGAYRSGAEWLNENIQGPAKVHIFPGSHMAAQYLRPDIVPLEYINSPEEVSYVMFYVQKAWSDQRIYLYYNFYLQNLQPIHIVEVDGNPIIYIYRLR